jgi:hypothetical protein
MEPMHAVNGQEAIGHLYTQTNELRNAVIRYRRSANGAIEEVDRVSTAAPGPASSSRPAARRARRTPSTARGA